MAEVITLEKGSSDKWIVMEGACNQEHKETEYVKHTYEIKEFDEWLP